MKRYFTLALLSFLFVSCMTNDEWRYERNKNNFENYFYEWRDNQQVDWYENDDYWRVLKSEFSDTMTKDIEFSKLAGGLIYTKYKFTSSIVMSKTLSNYVAMDESGEFGEFKMFLFEFPFEFKKDQHTYIGYTIVCPIPASAEDHSSPYIGNADTCIELSSSKYETINIQGHQIHCLGEYLLCNKSKVMQKENETVESVESVVEDTLVTAPTITPTPKRKFKRRKTIQTDENLSETVTLIDKSDNTIPTGETDVDEYGDTSNNDVYMVADVMPTFNGNINTYIKKHLKYPPIAKQYNISGEVELSFIVEKDGSLSHINVIQDIGADCGVEAVEMVKGMPKWKPAMHNEVPVRCIQKLSVCFEN